MFGAEQVEYSTFSLSQLFCWKQLPTAAEKYLKNVVENCLHDLMVEDESEI